MLFSNVFSSCDAVDCWSSPLLQCGWLLVFPAMVMPVSAGKWVSWRLIVFFIFCCWLLLFWFLSHWLLSLDFLFDLVDFILFPSFFIFLSLSFFVIHTTNKNSNHACCITKISVCRWHTRIFIVGDVDYFYRGCGLFLSKYWPIFIQVLDYYFYPGVILL